MSNPVHVRFQQCRDDPVSWGFDADLFAHPHDGAAQPRQFDRAAALEILQHGRLRARRHLTHGRNDLIKGRRCERNLPRARHGNRLMKRRFDHGEQIGGPIGQRVTAVIPLNAVSRANFAQMSTMMVSLSAASMPADRARRSSCSSSGSLAALSGPKMSRFMAVWRMTPGSEITAETYVVPPATCGSPTARVSTFTLSTPF
jgi:hypothetical protein